MLNVGVLTFQECAMKETIPLASIHEAVLEFLRGRDDVVLFGAHAVNAYAGEPRMTQAVDLLSPRAAELVEELRLALHQRFRIAVRIREIGEGKGYRLLQIQKSGNRHLVDIRPVEMLPAARRIEQVLVLAPVELIAMKVIAYAQRRGKPKAGTDWRDVATLLLTFPELKYDPGPVTACLQALGAETKMLSVWREFVHQAILPEAEDDEF